MVPSSPRLEIYLDHSATTPARSEAIATFVAVTQTQWGNPSSLHHWGERAATVLELARMQVAQLVGAADPEEIVFTSGGTEADNLALWGVVQRYNRPRHLIISSVEHPAIAAPVAQLENRGWGVTRLPVDRWGRVDPEDLRRSLRPDTVWISVIHGQSEVGTIQPIRQLGAIARAAGIPFHSDGVQTAGRLPLDLKNEPVDLFSLSAHKLYGLPGVGALYVRQGCDLLPWVRGGGQERGRRSGTPPVPLIAAFGTAAELAHRELMQETARLQQLRDRLFDRLADCPHLVPSGDRDDRLPHHLSFVIPPKSCLWGISGRAWVRQCNLAGIAISAGSACHSGHSSPSPILQAMGYDDTTALSGIRLTLGRSTTIADGDWTAMVLQQIGDRLCAEQPSGRSLRLALS